MSVTKQDLRKEQQAHNATRSELERVKAELRARADEVSAMRKSVDGLADDLRAAKRSADAMARVNAALTEEKAKLKAECEKMKDIGAGHVRDFLDVSSRLQIAEAGQTAANRDAKKASDKLAQAEARIADLESVQRESAAMARERDAAIAEVTAHSEALADATEKNAGLAGQVRDLLEVVKRDRAALVETDRAAQKSEARAAEAEARAADLAAEVERLLAVPAVEAPEDDGKAEAIKSARRDLADAVKRLKVANKRIAAFGGAEV